MNFGDFTFPHSALSLVVTIATAMFVVRVHCLHAPQPPRLLLVLPVLILDLLMFREHNTRGLCTCAYGYLSYPYGLTITRI